MARLGARRRGRLRRSPGPRRNSFLYRPLRESVEAICADLGLTPDWSRWTDDGFPPDTRTSRHEWKSVWGYGPERAEARRRTMAEKEAVAQARSAEAPDPHRRE
jgi:hypothetical protein